jgi:hypothetical protein
MQGSPIHQPDYCNVLPCMSCELSYAQPQREITTTDIPLHLCSLKSEPCKKGEMQAFWRLIQIIETEDVTVGCSAHAIDLRLRKKGVTVELPTQYGSVFDHRLQDVIAARWHRTLDSISTLGWLATLLDSDVSMRFRCKHDLRVCENCSHLVTFASYLYPHKWLKLNCFNLPCRSSIWQRLQIYY